MNRKDVLELKRRFKKGESTFTKMSGCYVDNKKEKVLDFKETFLNIPDTELFKYLEITRKVLSGGVGNNLLELKFSAEDKIKQNFIHRLKISGLKDDILLNEFYDSIISSFDYAENYLILLFHDVYDVMTKTTDNIKMDDSEESYEYILCAICPVARSKPGLGYFDTEQKIKARIRDWVVAHPLIGFVYPAFIDRSADFDNLMYYTKNAKDAHEELMENALGCLSKQTATIQKETFQTIIKDTVSLDEEVSEKVFINIQENLNTMIEEHKNLYEGLDAKPIILSKEKVKDILIDSGVSEEVSVKIETSYEESFGEQAPLAEHLLDTKIIKANVHKKKEEELLQKVKTLETKLKETNPLDEHLLENLETDDLDEVIEDNDNNSHNVGVVLHVKPSKVSAIKTEIINGQRCILVPLDDDEQATINGIDNIV